MGSVWYPYHQLNLSGIKYVAKYTEPKSLFYSPNTSIITNIFTLPFGENVDCVRFILGQASLTVGQWSGSALYKIKFVSVNHSLYVRMAYHIPGPEGISAARVNLMLVRLGTKNQLKIATGKGIFRFLVGNHCKQTQFCQLHYLNMRIGIRGVNHSPRSRRKKLLTYPLC